ncbi:restriction endonuclease subunit S [uncultured Brachyspira sp.]|uniref:restriction endonuclease subunit S n=1 Tax=uncultured Brachyspira sp. TaxID=221953 RepID=UPI0025F241FE|nr:restriction endonuclease subunit S [uncultured Brachyspira sp.]
MHKIILKDIANIRVGASVSRALAKRYEKGYKINLINLKAFDNKSVKYIQNEKNIDIIQIKQKNIDMIQANDIIIRLREPFNSLIIEENIDNCIISSLTAYIRIKSEFHNICLPHFIAIYLNDKKVQKYLKKKSRGTGIISIGAFDIANIEIELPDIEKQKEIIEINSLFERDIFIQERLFELKQIFYKEAMNKILKRIKY